MESISVTTDSRDLLEKHTRFTPVSLELMGDIAFEEWQALLLHVGAVSKASRWWVGDALVYGESCFGEMYSQAINDIGISYSALSNIVYTCKKIPPEERRPELSFTMHQELAHLPKEEREKWLDYAVETGATTKEIRGLTKEDEPEDALPEPKVSCTVTTLSGQFKLNIPTRLFEKLIREFGISQRNEKEEKYEIS